MPGKKLSMNPENPKHKNMKNPNNAHSSRSVAFSLATLFAAATCVPAFGAVMHTDVPIQVYTDFGQNTGRYTTSANALLDYIRERDGGIFISYSGGQESYLLEHGLIDFESTGDNGAFAALGNNFIATVAHNGVQNPTFSGRVIGTENAIHYATIEYRYSYTLSGDQHVFSHKPANDYKIARTSKLITDITGSTVYSRPEDAATLAGETLYRAGAGTQQLADYEGTTSARYGAYGYIIGGITEIDNANNNTTGEDDFRGNADDSFSVKWTISDWTSDGVNENDPMPNAIRAGDSGSPGWIWNDETQQYEYLAAGQSGGGFFSQSRGATQWTIETMESYDNHVALTEGIDIISVNAVNDTREDETVSCEIQNVSAMPTYGSVTDASGNVLAEFVGVKSGLNTWNSLSDLKDTQNWYAYGNSYLNSEISYAELFLTENLVFDAAQAETTVDIASDVDLGIGYVEFTAGTRETAKFTVSSEENHLLNSAGYVVGAGVDVYLTISNADAAFMREWRKIGEGNLHVAGTGNNEIFLNVGGNGKTYLEQTDGYAAYNVLTNSGSTVVIKDINQIARDFTFGAGGGELDMNGNSMTWKLVNSDVAADGFTVNALTEEAVIANRKAGTQSVLTYTEAGSTVFLGSFRDTESSSLKIIYDGGADSSWTLNSIRTNLQNEGSGLEVQSGTVTLAGTNTVHAIGSATGTSTARYTNEDDWHYADATMNVSVADGAAFRLGSHARLTGDVSVASGGTFVMTEGVRHDLEYIEGGYTLEDTGAISDFYGLKGNVSLEGSAEMRVEYSAGTTATTTYAGRISGEGNVRIALGEAGQAFSLAGDNSGFLGDIIVDSGTLLVGASSAVNSSVDIAVNKAGSVRFTSGGSVGDITFLQQGGNLVFSNESGESETVYNVNSVATRSVNNYSRNITVEEGATVNANSIINAWGLGVLTVDGALNVSGEIRFSTGRNGSTDVNRIAGTGTVSAESLVFGNVGVYTVDVARLEIGSGGMTGTGNGVNFGTTTVAVTESWAQNATTAFTVLSGSTLTFETENSSGEGTSATLAGAISGSGNIVKTGAGTLALAGGNTAFDGRIIVEEGVLKMAGFSGTLGLRDNNGTGERYAALVKTGGTLDIDGKTAGGNNCYKIELGGGALVNNGGDVTTSDRQITGLKVSADSTIGGSGDFGLVGSAHTNVTLDLGGNVLTKTGENTFRIVHATVTAGFLRIESGSVEVAAADTDASAADFVLAGGSLSLADSHNLSVKSVSGDSGTISVGTGTLTVGGETASGTYSGVVSFDEGGSIAFVGGTHDWTGISRSDDSTSGSFSLAGEGTLVKMSITETAAISVSESAVLELAAASDASTVDMSGVTGNGTVSLKLSNWNGRGFNFSAFTGTLEVGKGADTNVGRLRLNTSELNSQALIRIVEGGELVFDGSGTRVENNVEVTVDSVIHANRGRDGEISGVISGAAGITLTKAGGGTLTLSGNNQGFAGDVVVNAGILKITHENALGTGDVLVKSGAVLHLSVENTENMSAVTLAAGATLRLFADQVDSVAGTVLSDGVRVVVDIADLVQNVSGSENVVSITAETEMLVLFGADGRMYLDEAESAAALSVGEQLLLSAEKRAMSGSLTVPMYLSASASALSVPEPSAFGLLAGAGVLAIAISRRRRRKS